MKQNKSEVRNYFFRFAKGDQELHVSDDVGGFEDHSVAEEFQEKNGGVHLADGGKVFDGPRLRKDKMLLCSKKNKQRNFHVF